MIAVIISEEDVASVNIGEELLKIAEWRKEGEIYIHNDMLLYRIPDTHLYHDNVDMELKKEGYVVETVIFASRHSSKSHIKSLTVHPVGNFGRAMYGGRDNELVPSAPIPMKMGLKLLKEKAKEMEYEVSYEATHHGPYLSTPAFFIETGSTEEEWNDKKACRIIAETILEIPYKNESMQEVAIGIGGGHYAPRFTEIALRDGVAFGHIAARYAIEFLTEEMIGKMIHATYGCQRAYFHGRYKELEETVEKILGMHK